MRVADNKLDSLRRFFHEELSGIYPPGEINALFLTAAEHVLGWNRSQTLRRLGEHINQSELLQLYQCAKRLARHEPIQYITGVAWFFDLRLRVNRHVLIPRPETEELVRLVLEEFVSPQAKALDIGTGSGCIAIALKNQRPAWEIGGCDLSEPALDVATENARAQGCDVGFFQCDVLKDELPGEYDLIVSNPPYIQAGEAGSMHPNVRDFEPHTALFAPGPDPLIFYKKIAEICRMHLRAKGMVFLELNPLTAEDALTYFQNTGAFAEQRTVPDMSGKTRFLHARKK